MIQTWKFDECKPEKILGRPSIALDAQTQFSVSQKPKVVVGGTETKTKTMALAKQKRKRKTTSVSRNFAYHRLLNKQGNVNHHRQQVTQKIEKMAEEKTIKRYNNNTRTKKKPTRKKNVSDIKAPAKQEQQTPDLPYIAFHALMSS